MYLPSAVVHELADEFDGRLGAVHLSRRHVQVVDEEYEVLAERWPEDALAALVKLRVDQVLRLVGAGACGECEEFCNDVARHVLQQFVRDRQRFTRSRRPNAQNLQDDETDKIRRIQ